MRILKIFFLATLIISSCDHYPKDPENSLEKALNGTLKVGIADSPDRCMYNDGNPQGIEVDLIKGFAQSINAKVEWVPGSQEDISNLLKEYELDLGIGGFSKKTPLKRHVGLTRPYDVEKIKVAAPSVMQLPDKVKDKEVVVKKGSAALVAVKKKGGIPVPVDSIIEIDFLMAASEDKITESTTNISAYDLDKIKHVIAVPRGENALLKKLEDYIYSEWKNKKIKTSL